MMYLNAREYLLSVKQNTNPFGVFLLSQRYFEEKRRMHLLLNIELLVLE